MKARMARLGRKKHSLSFTKRPSLLRPQQQRVHATGAFESSVRHRDIAMGESQLSAISIKKLKKS